MTSHHPLFDLTGKSAIVTGASYGLGVTMANTLAAAGARVTVAARNLDKLTDVARQIEAAGGLALPAACDVGDPAQVDAHVAATIARWGRVDIVVNNAGIAAEAGSMPEHVTPDLFEQTVRVNLLGVWYVCQAAGASMLRDGQGGSIINIASIAGLAGWRDNPPAYQATKAAVINLTRTLACSWADRGVRVNAIAPGWFPSEMTGPFLEIGTMRQRLQDSTPMGRLGEPDELSGPLLFLASSASSYVTGHTLVVDGGWSASSGHFSFPDDTYAFFEANVPDGRGVRIRP